jgi:hypothetical protein
MMMMIEVVVSQFLLLLLLLLLYSIISYIIIISYRIIISSKSHQCISDRRPLTCSTHGMRAAARKWAWEASGWVRYD